MMRPKSVRSALIIAVSLIATTAGQLAPAGASGVAFAPTQNDCDSGSVSPTWPQTGISVRPHITSVVIDGETISPSRLDAPQDGEIGAAICAQDPNFAKNSGLSFYRKVSGSTTTPDLTGARTPLGQTITASSRIVVTITMGDLSPYFSFTTVFGKVNAWATSGIRTSAATITASFSPVNGVMVDGRDDFGNPSPSEEGCTQQPPNCSPVKADGDTFGVYMQFKAERGAETGFNSFAGGYFALQSAVGGFVAPRGDSLDVTIAGPHYKADGTTLNVGSMSAFLPETFLQQSFGLNASQVTNETFAVTRTSDGSTAPAPWTYSVVPGGITVDVAAITFSSPLYRIAKSGASGPGASTSAQWPAPPFFHVVKHGRTVTAGFAAAPKARYVVTYTNLRSTYHLNVTSTTTSWKGRWVSKTLSKGTWLVVSRQIVPGGYSAASVKVLTI